MNDEEKQAWLGTLADEIEAEMRGRGVWFDDPKPESDVLAGGAFGMGTSAFEEWLQVVFVPRLQQAAAGELDVPASSSVGDQAYREWEMHGPAAYDTRRLLELIRHVDATVNG